jgi:hypothetical protein
VRLGKRFQFWAIYRVFNKAGRINPEVRLLPKVELLYQDIEKIPSIHYNKNQKIDHESYINYNAIMYELYIFSSGAIYDDLDN